MESLLISVRDARARYPLADLSRCGYPKHPQGKSRTSTSALIAPEGLPLYGVCPHCEQSALADEWEREEAARLRDLAIYDEQRGDL